MFIKRNKILYTALLLYFFFFRPVGWSTTPMLHSVRLIALSFRSLKVLTFASLLICLIQEFRGRPAVPFPFVILFTIQLCSSSECIEACPIISQHLALIASTNLRFSLAILSTSSSVFLSVQPVPSGTTSQKFSIFSSPYRLQPVFQRHTLLQSFWRVSF